MANFTTRCIAYSDLLHERTILDSIYRQFENINAFEFTMDERAMGYIMRVQLKDPDFRWIVEDF